MHQYDERTCWHTKPHESIKLMNIVNTFIEYIMNTREPYTLVRVWRIQVTKATI